MFKRAQSDIFYVFLISSNLLQLQQPSTWHVWHKMFVILQCPAHQWHPPSDPLPLMRTHGMFQPSMAFFSQSWHLLAKRGMFQPSIVSHIGYSQHICILCVYIYIYTYIYTQLTTRSSFLFQSLDHEMRLATLYLCISLSATKAPGLPSRQECPRELALPTKSSPP